MAPNNDEIRQLAYRLWEEEGRPEGKSQEHWSRAIALLGPDTPDATNPVATAETPAKAKSPTAAKKPVARRSGRTKPKP